MQYIQPAPMNLTLILSAQSFCGFSFSPTETSISILAFSKVCKLKVQSTDLPESVNLVMMIMYDFLRSGNLLAGMRSSKGY